MMDTTIQRVFIRDLPGVRVAFGISLEQEFTVEESDYHSDDYYRCYIIPL